MVGYIPDPGCLAQPGSVFFYEGLGASDSGVGVDGRWPRPDNFIRFQFPEMMIAGPQGAAPSLAPSPCVYV